MTTRPQTSCLVLWLIVACGPAVNAPDSGTPDAGGGGGFDGGAVGGGTTGGGAAGGGPSEQDRITAATQTAATNPACSPSLLPEGFYWEIGDRNGLRASGTVSGTDTPTASRVLAIASSSKWIYSTYVLQKVGSVRSSDLPFLHFTSGTVFPASKALKEVVCGPTETVGACAADVVQNPAAVDHFFYSAGHFQYHAANVMGLASMNASALTTEITSSVGTFDFVYLQTNLAGGLNASATGYAAFLRRLLRGEYVMSSQLGTNKVCASSACTTGAVLSPAPPDEAWSYSLGHWVEDDPTVGDHAFSSAGALGFYPWIDSTKTWYGVLARRASSPAGNEGVTSLRCGRLIRQAWVTGVTATSSTPTPH